MKFRYNNSNFAVILSLFLSFVPYEIVHAGENSKSNVSVVNTSNDKLPEVEKDEDKENELHLPKNIKKDKKVISNRHNPFSFVLKILDKIYCDIKKYPNALRSLAHSILFCGKKDDDKCIKKLKKIFEVEKVYIKWEQPDNKIDDSKKNELIYLHGYIFRPKSEDYDTVCICFGSDMKPCHKMVTEDSYSKILYICIDYPSFGSSDYIWLDENKMFEFDDFIYNYVSEKYKDKKLIAMGFSLGGFGASYMSQKERISEIYLISPVYLPGILGEKFCKYLFGYELNFIKNLENCNHECEVYIISGDKTDFLSLYYTLIYYFYDKLSDDQDIDDQIQSCISFLEENKNLNIYYEIADGYNHLTVHPYAIRIYSEVFLSKNEEKIEENNLLLKQAS